MGSHQWVHGTLSEPPWITEVDRQSDLLGTESRKTTNRSSRKFSVLTEAEVLLRVLGLALCHYEENENEMSMIGVLGLTPCHYS